MAIEDWVKRQLEVMIKRKQVHTGRRREKNKGREIQGDPRDKGDKLDDKSSFPRR